MSIKIPEVKEMFLTGMHFGHKKQYSHPKAKEYIFGLRDGVNIIDLSKTQELLTNILEFIQKEVKNGKTILFVGTKKQIKDIVRESAIKCGMPYITQRWLGGTLTNFETIRKGIKYLEDSETRIADPNSDLTKKERALLDKEVIKLKGIYDGIRSMRGLPDYLFIIDPVKERNALSEAKKNELPVIAICDTDADPRTVDYYIPANDDSKASVEMIMNLVTEAILDVKSAIRGSTDSGKDSDKKVVEPVKDDKEVKKVEKVGEKEEK